MDFGVGDRFLFVLIISTIAYRGLNFFQFIFVSITVITAWIFFQYRQKLHWQNLGVPGPKVNIFFGNTLTLIRNGTIDVDRENFAKYGNSFGSFVFDRREFCTKDPEMIRQIFIKQFSHFQNRFDFVPGQKEDSPKSLTRNMINMLRDEDWKRVRNRVTPAFTTGKLKKLIPILCESTERLCKVFEDEYAPEKKEIQLKEIYGRFLLDVIGRCGLSLDLNTFEEENVFVEQARMVFNFGTKTQRTRTMFCVFFPFTAKCVESIIGKSIAFGVDEQFFMDILNDLYEKRRADPQAKEKYSDIFQLLMNAVDEEVVIFSLKKNKTFYFNRDNESANGNGTISADDAQIIHSELQQQKQLGKKHLSKIELFAQSFIILVAGFDTTGATLTFATYMLAVKSDVQEKLRQEVNDVLGEKEVITYELLKHMHYLCAVVQETLRMFPVAPKTNRECNRDCVINGFPFQKGDLITLPIYVIQHDDAYFSNPDEFEPERFMPDQKSALDPLAFLTFGIGPRNCIGMRFAEFQMHVALALLVRRFRFRPGPNTTKYPPKLLSSELLRTVEPLVVVAEKI